MIMFKKLKILLKNKKYIHYLKGILAEYYVFIFLCLKGYKPVSRRVRQKSGEIDLLFIKKRTLIAIEVKLRKTIDLALYSVHDTQKQRIRHSLEKISHQFQSFALRCDVCAVNHRGKIYHLHNAF